MTDWKTVLRKIAPGASPAIVNGFAAAMPRVIQIANLNTDMRLAQFLAQVAHESAGLKTTVEYASGKAYEGRKDLGNTQPGDGVRYKGRGLIQCTGRANYAAMSKALGEDFVKNPEELADFPWAALSAAEYWRSRNINRYADRNDINGVTKVINGGYNGLDDRKIYLSRAISILKTPGTAVTTDPSVDVRRAQQRLAELSYPLGAFDGEIGPLTRSAIRDFQDAMGLPVTGDLDKKTYDELMSDLAVKRPVSQSREFLTAAKLKDAGSVVINATDGIKSNIATASGALAAASGIASNVTDAAGQVQSIKDAVKTGNESFSWLRDNWQTVTIILLLIVVVVCIWRIWVLANTVEARRLDEARKGENVRF